jgi:hypothetical protein
MVDDMYRAKLNLRATCQSNSKQVTYNIRRRSMYWCLRENVFSLLYSQRLTFLAFLVDYHLIRSTNLDSFRYEPHNFDGQGLPIENQGLSRLSIRDRTTGQVKGKSGRRRQNLPTPRKGSIALLYEKIKKERQLLTKDQEKLMRSLP